MRKLFAVIVALVMLAMPVMGMAASPAELLDAAWESGAVVETNVRFELGDLPLDEETKAVVTDIVNALGVHTIADPDGKTFFALTLQGQDAVTLGTEMVNDDLYVSLPLVSAQVMAFTPEEALKLLERLVVLAGEAAGLSPEELAQVEGAFTMGLESGLSAAAENTAAMEMPELDMDQLMTQLMSAVTAGEVKAQPADCDKATSLVTVTITPEIVESAMKLLCDAVKATPDMMNALANADIDWSINGQTVTLDKFLAEAPATVAAELKETYGNIPVNVYTDDAGNPVCIDMTMTPVSGGAAETLLYTRQTKADGAHHSVKVLTGADGVRFVLVDNCDENVTDYRLEMYEVAANTDGAMLVEGQFKQTRVRDDDAAFDMTELYLGVPTGDSSMPFVKLYMTAEVAALTAGSTINCTTNVKLGCDVLGGDLLTVKVNTTAGAGEIASIAGGESVRPGAMTDEEFDAFIQNVPTNALTTVFSLLQLLPPSVMQLLMG